MHKNASHRLQCSFKVSLNVNAREGERRVKKTSSMHSGSSLRGGKNLDMTREAQQENATQIQPETFSASSIHSHFHH